MTIDQINFKPLEQIQNVFKLALRNVLKPKFSKKSIPIILLVILSIILLIFLPGFFMISIFVFVILISIQQSKIKKKAWLEFANLNGWEIDNQTSVLSLVPPGLRRIGHGEKINSDVIVAKFDNLSLDLLTYQFTINYGKSSVTYYFTIACMRLPKSFPHIILDSKNNKGGLRNIPSGYENLKLEENFDNYFKLYVAKGAEIDVLSIISPDVMQTLINANQQQDIEIYNDYLYFIGINDQRQPAALRTLLHSVSKLAPEILHRAQTLEYLPPTQS